MQTIKTGEVYKKSQGVFSSWSRKYLHLVEDDGSKRKKLLYFDEKTAATPKASIELMGAKIAHEEDVKETGNDRKKTTFRVTTSARDFLFSCSSQADRDDWIILLTRAIFGDMNVGQAAAPKSVRRAASVSTGAIEKAERQRLRAEREAAVQRKAEEAGMRAIAEQEARQGQPPMPVGPEAYGSPPNRRPMSMMYDQSNYNMAGSMQVPAHSMQAPMHSMQAGMYGQVPGPPPPGGYVPGPPMGSMYGGAPAPGYGPPAPAYGHQAGPGAPQPVAMQQFVAVKGFNFAEYNPQAGEPQFQVAAVGDAVSAPATPTSTANPGPPRSAPPAKPAGGRKLSVDAAGNMATIGDVDDLDVDNPPEKWVAKHEASTAAAARREHRNSVSKSTRIKQAQNALDDFLGIDDLPSPAQPPPGTIMEEPEFVTTSGGESPPGSRPTSPGPAAAAPPADDVPQAHSPPYVEPAEPVAPVAPAVPGATSNLGSSSSAHTQPADPPLPNKDDPSSPSTPSSRPTHLGAVSEVSVVQLDARSEASGALVMPTAVNAATEAERPGSKGSSKPASAHDSPALAPTAAPVSAVPPLTLSDPAPATKESVQTETSTPAAVPVVSKTVVAAPAETLALPVSAEPAGAPATPVASPPPAVTATASTPASPPSTKDASPVKPTEPAPAATEPAGTTTETKTETSPVKPVEPVVLQPRKSSIMAPPPPLDFNALAAPPPPLDFDALAAPQRTSASNSSTASPAVPSSPALQSVTLAQVESKASVASAASASEETPSAASTPAHNSISAKEPAKETTPVPAAPVAPVATTVTPAAATPTTAAPAATATPPATAPAAAPAAGGWQPTKRVSAMSALTPPSRRKGTGAGTESSSLNRSASEMDTPTSVRSADLDSPPTIKAPARTLLNVTFNTHTVKMSMSPLDDPRAVKDALRAMFALPQDARILLLEPNGVIAVISGALPAGAYTLVEGPPKRRDAL